MAETAGLVIGGVGLAALFVTSVQAFEYVDTAREYGGQYQRLTLRLSILHLRLSRWGASVQFEENSRGDLASHQLVIASQADVATVRRLLGEIFTLLEDACEASYHYKPTISRENDHINTSRSANINALVKMMRSIALSRQKQATAMQKTRWALRDEKKLRRLVEDLTGLVSDLVELFPASQAAQQALASEDAAVLTNSVDGVQRDGEDRDQIALREDLLVEHIAMVDPLLVAAVADIATTDRRHAFNSALAIDDVRMHNGDFVSEGSSVVGYGHDYHGVLASGRARVLNGNRYGGKSVLDD
ncbi:hypothetical protein LTR17_026219 [Elasticomyces elasticus]|nr:hypothetical protein LTR17_026219 [Elasticomyces elasticus]